MDLAAQLEYIFTVRGLLIEGLGISLLIALVAVIIGFFIGVILAMIKIAPKNNAVIKVLDKIADLYITVIRGTPMLVQLLIMYGVVLVSFKSSSTNLIVPIVSFGINSGAYMAEIIRSGINSIDKGQMEAGRALGLSQMTTMRKIILPQAIKNVIPAIGNELIALLKETSIISIVGSTVGTLTFDLNSAANTVAHAKDMAGAYLASAVCAAAFYLLIVYLLTFLIKKIEGRLRASDQR